MCESLHRLKAYLGYSFILLLKENNPNLTQINHLKLSIKKNSTALYNIYISNTLKVYAILYLYLIDFKPKKRFFLIISFYCVDIRIYGYAYTIPMCTSTDTTERKFCCLFLESPLINYNYQPEDLLVWLDNLSSLTLLSFSLTHTLTHTHTHSHTY